MKKFIFLSICMAVLSLGACKTTEANYRTAYETAKQKATDTGDSLTTQNLRQSMMPRPLTVDGITFDALTLPVRVTEGTTADVSALKRYCIVVGKFRQVFNAKSMASRLVSGGYPGAFVVENRDKEFFVVAQSTEISTEIPAILDRIAKDSSLTLREPYPYVLRPAQLVR